MYLTTIKIFSKVSEIYISFFFRKYNCFFKLEECFTFIMYILYTYNVIHILCTLF